MSISSSSLFFLILGTFLSYTYLLFYKLKLKLFKLRHEFKRHRDNHYLQINSSGGSVVSYALYRRTGTGSQQVDQTRSVPDDVAVTASHSTLEFDFDGSALASYAVTVAGPDRSWLISVNQLTGAVQVTETLP